MKKCIFFIFSLFFLLHLKAQEDTTLGWHTDGISQLNFSQAAFVNWAKGGENNIAVTALLQLNADLIRKRSRWNNTLKLAYGKIKSGEQVRKSDDIIDLTSKYSRDLTDKLKYGVLFNFNTQFDKGYIYPDDSTIVSKFLSPAFIALSLGIDYLPNESWSFFVSPLSGKFTFINDTVQVDQTRYGLERGEKWREEIGALAKVTYKQEIMKNVSLNSSLELFSNYLHRPGNIDINWEVLLGLKVNEYVQASVSTQLLYDHDILVPKTNDSGEDYLGVGTQFKEVIAVGLSYNF